ncbi:MAG: hypothetical protein IKL53_04735 [Lachnospiraceae bacterium]|nr:hypothetical protein [Lachnospiraceae bacterium]
MIYSSKRDDINKYKSMSESVSSEDVNANPFTDEDKKLTFADYMPETTKEDEYPIQNNYVDPAIMEAFTMHFDMTDTHTRRTIMSMNEADQSTLLASLTSKLYDNIVSKVDDIDYGEIPMTKGDVTKLSNYDKLRECIRLLRDILKQFQQDTSPVDEISIALDNIVKYKDLFMRAYKLDVELPVIMYNNMVLSIINGVSYMIATSIEFIKTPNKDSFEATLNKVAFAKTKSHMLYTNIKRFNKCCNNKDFEKAMNHIINQYVSKHEGAVLGTVGAAISGLWVSSNIFKIGCVVALLTSIIPIMRELIFLFYYTRMRVSEFFDIQADLLQVNASNVENNETMDRVKREKIVNGQMKIVNFFRNIANKIAINGRKAEVEATKDIEVSNRKMNINDMPTTSVLF